MKRILAADFGSTTTKVILFEKTDLGWRKKIDAAAPTTVEKPVSNICIGLKNAINEIQETSEYRFFINDSFIFDVKDKQGIDIFLATSSAGGGLQVLVCGLSKAFSTSKANKASLSAGAIILDSLSLDDERTEQAKVDLIRDLKPDIILLTGGTENGAKEQVLELAQTILQAESKPRFATEKLTPVIYAGNSANREIIEELLKDKYSFLATENISPKTNLTNSAPVRDLIHQIFMEHVMSQSPGYDELSSLVGEPIIPTPSAVGDMIETFAKTKNAQVLAVDIGGATTDIFSSVKDESKTQRSVSANLGMSYSIANVLKESGIDAIKKWLPFSMDTKEIFNIIRNKMIRPSTIPQNIEDLVLEQAIARQALKLALKHHEDLFFKNLNKRKGISALMGKSEKSGINMFDITHIIGAGGVLSHAPNRLSAAQTIIEAFECKGITEIYVDSVFMLPHLGAINKISPEIADEILLADCLIPVCLHIAPIGNNLKLATVEFDNQIFKINKGELSLIPYNSQEIKLTLERNVKIDNLSSEKLIYNPLSNFSYLILDGRNGNFSERKLANSELRIKYE